MPPIPQDSTITIHGSIKCITSQTFVTFLKTQKTRQTWNLCWSVLGPIFSSAVDCKLELTSSPLGVWPWPRTWRCHHCSIPPTTLSMDSSLLHKHFTNTSPQALLQFYSTRLSVGYEIGLQNQDQARETGRHHCWCRCFCLWLPCNDCNLPQFSHLLKS